MNGSYEEPVFAKTSFRRSVTLAARFVWVFRSSFGQHDEEAIKAFPHHGAIDIDQVTLASGIALQWPTSLSVVVPLK